MQTPAGTNVHQAPVSRPALLPPSRGWCPRLTALGLPRPRNSRPPARRWRRWSSRSCWRRRSSHVGQDLAEDDPQLLAADLRRGDEVLLAQRERLGAHHPRRPGPAGDGQHQDEVARCRCRGRRPAPRAAAGGDDQEDVGDQRERRRLCRRSSRRSCRRRCRRRCVSRPTAKPTRARPGAPPDGLREDILPWPVVPSQCSAEGGRWGERRSRWDRRARSPAQNATISTKTSRSRQRWPCGCAAPGAHPS